MTRVLITGVSSGLGIATAQMLVNYGAEVLGISRRPNPPALLDDHHLEWLLHDLSDGSPIPVTGSFDAVVNCASALPSDSPAALNQIGLQAARNLVSSIHFQEQAMWIQISSLSVYGTPSSEVLSHETCLNGSTNYGTSKVEIEDYLIRQQSLVRRVHCLRLPALAYVGNARHLLRRWSDASMLGQTITLRNANSLFNAIVDEVDVARYIADLIIATRHQHPESRLAYPLASIEPIRIEEAAEMVVKRVGSNSAIHRVRSPLPGTVIDDSLARGVFGYRSCTVTAAIQKYLDSLDASGDLSSG